MFKLPKPEAKTKGKKAQQAVPVSKCEAKNENKERSSIQKKSKSTNQTVLSNLTNTEAKRKDLSKLQKEVKVTPVARYTNVRAQNSPAKRLNQDLNVMGLFHKRGSVK